MWSLFAASLSSEAGIHGGEMEGWGEAVEGVAEGVVADAVVDAVSLQDAPLSPPLQQLSSTATAAVSPTHIPALPSTVDKADALDALSPLEVRLRTAESLGYPFHRDPLPALQHLCETASRPQRYDDWLLQRRVRVRKSWAEEDVGDSCCFGTRTVEGGRGWID